MRKLLLALVLALPISALASGAAVCVIYEYVELQTLTNDELTALDARFAQDRKVLMMDVGRPVSALDATEATNCKDQQTRIGRVLAARAKAKAK